MLPRELARARRNHAELGFLMVDIDHFKVINDTYGHKSGDEALQTIADSIVSNLRASDIVCRFGGEEILCLILEATEDTALRRAEQLRLAISHLPIIVSHPDVRVTVSIGVALFAENTSDITSALNAADRALYQAKESGRNCVRLADG
jgi:diguanylate cyclase (GGDEF)-like protein